ncbi:hypothetical protein KKF69_08015, partial [Patescibacteria group bacterium]|nr:hypothetical protein [Patescibacteria group bacterium]
MEPNNKEVLSAAPPVEALGQKERLINKEATGAQVLWLLGINPNTTAENIINDKYDKDKLKESVEKGIPQAHKDKINKASFNEREEYWENKKDIKAEDRMKEWEKGMNAFLDPIKEDQTKVTFLKNILKKDGEDPNNVTINAKNIYDTFMRGQGNGDVQFFVKSIVDNNEFGDIEKNQDLIRNLGKIYGDNSAKISELLTHGMANVKYKENEFFVSAQENLNQKNYGDPEIWNTLDKNSGSWDEKQAKIKEAERIAAEAVVEKKKQEEEAKKKENEKKTPVIRSLEKDKDEVEDAYNIVANQDAEKIKEEWNGHQKLTISALNEPVVIDEEVIRDYNELVAQYAIKENKEVPFFFVEDTENKRIVKIFVGEAKSYGSTELSPITAKAKDGEIFADWWNGENNKKNLFNGKDGRFKVGMGHTHPKGYGPMFSNVGEGDFGLDYSSEFEFRSSALFAANPCASNISFVGS